MRTLKAAGLLTGVATFALSACATVPSARVTVDRMDYGHVIAESWKRQTLLNVVRIRYADAPVFLDVASVINSYSLGGSVSAGVKASSGATNEVQLGGAGTWSNTPTVTYQPLMGDRFTRSLLEPIPPAAVLQLMQGGWAPDLVMRTAVSSINGLHNDSFGVGADAGFGQLVDALSRLQRAGGLGNRVEARKDGSAVILLLGAEREGRQDDVRIIRDLLRLDPDANELEVVYGMAARSGREVAMVTRSMLEIMLMMGLGIDLPAPTRDRALAFQRQADEAAVTPVTPLVHVRSGTAMPADAFVGVQYRGQQYWIADDDVASKRTFTFLLILFSLAETGQTAATPVVTVPSR